MTDYLFVSSKEHLDLASSEIEVQTETKPKVIAQGIFLISKPKSSSVLEAKKFGFVKQILLIKKIFSTKTFPENLENIKLENSFKINILGNKSLTTKDLANKIFLTQKNPLVDLETPTHNYYFIFENEVIYFAEEISKNEDKPNERKAHKKRFNHPTSLNPKFAKAMINQVKTDEFHDPFCGVGGLVIEGALMGLKVSGSDILKSLVFKAEKNAEDYGLKINFFQADALSLKTNHPTIITDLPYGKNSFIKQDIKTLYTKFFEHSQQSTDQMVVGMTDEIDLNEFIKDTSWKQMKEFKIFVHKSLTKKIYVLKNQRTK